MHTTLLSFAHVHVHMRVHTTLLSFPHVHVHMRVHTILLSFAHVHAYVPARPLCFECAAPFHELPFDAGGRWRSHNSVSTDGQSKAAYAVSDPTATDMAMAMSYSDAGAHARPLLASPYEQ